ncbi:MAG: hypothetical protein KatS3mg015_2820 [Fimbriimonadales bacterium]|nr:MAG: hypothetical protein KatS3mg015_2820 [Fimbriimonadales bacterium]
MTNKQRVAAIRRARRHLHAAAGYRPDGKHYREIDKILDALEADFAAKPKWADIGPVTAGGPSLLDMSLTHKTSGIPLFPAVDLAWGAGIPIYAPETLTIDTKDTSANPGNAVYATGRSGLRYWIGHIDRDWPLGTVLAKGSLIGKTVSQPDPKKNHAHIGVNAEALLGKGKQFKYGRDGNGPDYTLGAPTIREQLLALEK